MEDWIHSDAIVGNAYFDNMTGERASLGNAVPDTITASLDS
jgi:hypothetical protein